MKTRAGSRHVIVGGQSHMINMAIYDVDGDGIPEIALATEFSNRPPQSKGVVSILTHDADPDKPWSVRKIDEIPTAHRLRWVDIDGSGKKVLVNAPLAGSKGDTPDFRDTVTLVMYRPGEWKRELIANDEGVMHGIYVNAWDGGKRESILTASFRGIFLHQWLKGMWQNTELAKGDPGAWPQGGSSDIAVGHLGRERYLAAVEPWHGTKVAVYREKSGTWQRQVIDDQLKDGHTIVTGDFDGKGRDAIVAGYRGEGRSVYLYQLTGGKWERSTVDGGDMAAAACATGDLNGDGRLDLVCIGSATKNLKWYENHKP